MFKSMLNNMSKCIILLIFFCANNCFASTEIEVAGKTYTVSDLSFEWSKEIIVDTVENSTEKITKYTDIVFKNAIYRVPYFVEVVYGKRRDQEYWLQEFNRLVLDQKGLNSLFNQVSKYYKDDLKNTLKKIAIKMIENKIVDANEIIYNASTSVDLERLKKSLPTAKEMANDIYVKLEEKGLNEPSIEESFKKYLVKLKSHNRRSDTYLGKFINFLLDPEGGMSIFIAPVHLYCELVVNQSMESYEINTVRLIREQRNNYREMLIEGYTNLLADEVNRMEGIIDKVIEEYGKGLNNVVP